MIVRVQGEAEIQNHIYYEYDSESVPLGQGGMGIVYQGYCFNEDNPEEYVPVAIKSIQNPTRDLVDRAMREASIQIDHPNLLRMYGFIPNMEKEGRQIYDSLITYNDEYFVLRDLENYIEAQEKIDKLYKNKEKWNEMALINIANSGIFSSDRTIIEYAEDIWFKGCE